MFQKAKRYKFLFKELVKRDFKKKYNKTALGMIWSVLHPTLDFLVMRVVFSYLFQRNIDHYTTYLFSGVLVNSFFHESTNGGMFSLTQNAGILQKINVPKYIFLLSKNVSVCINFALTSVVYFAFIIIGDGIRVSWHFLALLYPVGCLLIFNLGMGLILSAMYVFFKDTQYLYSIFCKMLTYVSAVFYSIESFPEKVQSLFYLNPIYDYITYFRIITMENRIPDLRLHLLCAVYAVVILAIGMLIYKRSNYKFVFYF